ncbi:MAG: N-formylglutamate amidohydrolase [Deltaproteobacteria bacterium]|nr:N-formylglutamate amidohydrolase [Deltaproteobacteria bacterium]MBN2845160.1 N-formylglutamate amidohydrolase [Deltaproteobacteria bacterium]
MGAQDLLVVIPHSGVVIPNEIPLESLSEDFFVLVQNVDWYTNWLYDFRDILSNRHLVFQYCSIVIEGNRHPEMLDDSVPLQDVRGRPVYIAGHEPSMELRASLSSRYLKPFHSLIESSIAEGATFLLDGHSTVTARGVADNQIDLMNFQHSRLDKERVYYCPEIYVETYASELRKRLPDVKVTVNSSEYYTVYGHVCAAHSVNEMKPVGLKAPALIQETNERLYKNIDRTPNVLAINRLRRAFAESIQETLRIVRGERSSK